MVEEPQFSREKILTAMPIRFSTEDLRFDHYDASVLHTDKIAKVSGGWGNLPVHTTVDTEAVFRLQNGTDLALTLYDRQARLYPGQEVLLIAANGKVMAYVDRKASFYQYTLNDPARTLGIGLPFWICLLTGIAGAVIMYQVKGADDGMAVVLPVFISVAVYLLQRLFFNWQIRKRVHAYITG